MNRLRVSLRESRNALLFIAAIASVSANGSDRPSLAIELASCVGPYLTIASNAQLSEPAKSQAKVIAETLIRSIDRQVSLEAWARGVDKQLVYREVQEKGKARVAAIFQSASALPDSTARNKAIGDHLDFCSALALKQQTQ